MPTPLNILLCNLPSFHKQYSNEKPFRASLTGFRTTRPRPRLLFNKHRSAASQIRYCRFSRYFGVRNVVHAVACIDLLVLFHCLKTLRRRIKFTSPSLLLCARSQAVFGGIRPVETSIHTEGGKFIIHCCLPVCFVR